MKKRFLILTFLLVLSFALPLITSALAEDLIKFSWQNASVVNVNGHWKVVDGSMWLLDYGTNQALANQALKVIKYYKLNQQGFVGRPNPPMQYYLTNGHAPVGAMAGEDCIPFKINLLQVKQVSGRWKVVEGDSHWLLDFNTSKENAVKALKIIKKYKFTNICFVGRPNPPMMYFRK